MKMTRRFQLQTWNGETVSVAVDYLTSRGFRDARVQRGASGLAIVGTRGSWIGNLTSFDMSKLRSRIEVEVGSSGLVGVALNVNTLGQHVTDWNRAFWRLELVELCWLATNRGHIADVWARYSRPRRQSAIAWALSGAILGRRLSDGWAAEIEQLERCFIDKGPA